MWKKLLIGIFILASSISVAYGAFDYIFQRNISAATNLNILIPGDKVIVGLDANGNEVVWTVTKDNSSYYALVSTSFNAFGTCTSSTNNLSSDGSGIKFCDLYTSAAGKSHSPVYIKMKQFDDAFTAGFSSNDFENSDIQDVSSIALGDLTHMFVPSVDLLISGGIGYGAIPSGIGMTGSVRRTKYDNISVPYFPAFDPSQKVIYDTGNAFRPNGTAYPNYIHPQWGCYGGSCDAINWRVFSYMDSANILYALNSDIKQDTLTATPKSGNLKIRYADSAYTIAFSDMKYKGNSIVGKQLVKDQTIQLDATASNTLSAFVFDETGNTLLYYKALLTNDFDLTGIPAGKYKIAVANEHFDSTTGRAAKSSPISDMKDIEIVEPLKISVTSNSGLEYSKNVNQNDVVATFTTNDGAAPISTSLISDTSVSGHTNDYQLFAISNGNVIVNDPNGLNAGDYYFKMKATDANGDPTGGIESGTIHISVAKKNTTIAFDNPNQTKISITQAGTVWNETATVTPQQGSKASYAVSGGNAAVISIDPDTGAITYKGNNAFGLVKIKATGDDDPSTGFDNYNPSTVEKEILVYREVDAAIIPHSNSSDPNTPTFSMDQPNIKIGGTIATISGMLGTPDNITGGTTIYTYMIKNGGDSNLFQVDANTGVITTKADLGVDVYSFQVTVSDKWSSKDVTVNVNVGMAPAENLKFYENSTSNTVITIKSAVSTDTGVNVFATVKGSTNNNPVTYKIKDGSTNVITVNPNSGAITIHGVGTVIIVAEKQGASGQADAYTELTFTVTAGDQNFIYTDSTLSNELPKSGGIYSPYTETYSPSKTFQLYTSGNPTGSTVTYQLKAGGSSDVIRVDSNGLVTILNASQNKDIGKVIVQATSHDPSGNYVDKTIELPITIEKGTRVIAFEDNPIYVLNGSGSVTPNIMTEGKLDTDHNTTIEIDPSENTSIAWTNDGETIQYSWNDAKGKDIKISVTKPVDRNYKAANANGILHILGADENVLTLSTPGKITYGDHFTIRSTQDDSMSTNVQYTFESDNQVFISAPQANGNKAEFDAIGNSGSTEITIKVTRTADGELPLTKSVKIKVLPKPITIEIEDKTKKRLEENPTLTIKDISHELVSWNGVKDNVDTSVIQLSTTAGKYSPIGSYPITSKNYTTLNDNYPNYIFTIKEGLLNVTDNGNKDFWDMDDDGCPDLNIQIKDEEGNDITINGDVNEDGIPDYNIDSNGDGKPDLNIDTDHDGKPDLNLVILKEWKPSKCVTLGDIQYSSVITAKPEINIDVDGDMIPDINIDTDGDFKADFNIDADQDGKANVNIGTVHTPWTPDKDYTYQGFTYDTDVECEPYLNIDTDGDNRPDINLDLDGDGKPDINIDVDGDRIPDTNIDSTGDGKPDINVDTDNDGNPDENIVEITEWKPEHNVDKPFSYDTMKIESRPKLEDQGVIIEKPDGGNFLPNMALKVIDVTAEKKEAVTSKAADLIKEGQEVKQVYEIKLLENGIEVKPDGIWKIRIPIADDIKNPTLIRQKKDGSYEKIDAIIEGGYLVYESDELGIVSIIGDLSSEIQGSYYPGDNVGGALTGDTTNLTLYMVICLYSLVILLCVIHKHQQKNN